MNDLPPLELGEDKLAPLDVRFLDIHAEPWPDGRRVRAHITLTPFLQRPNLFTAVLGPDGTEICSAHIIESMDSKMVFTLHLRGEQTSGTFTLSAEIFYEETGVVDQRAVPFEIHAETAN